MNEKLKVITRCSYIIFLEVSDETQQANPYTDYSDTEEDTCYVVIIDVLCKNNSVLKETLNTFYYNISCTQILS